MTHIVDVYYRGHELVIIQDDDKTFIVDVRADGWAGDFIAGYSGLDTAEQAIAKGRAFIDMIKSGVTA